MTRDRYVDEVLSCYEALLGAGRRAHPPDRRLTAMLYRRRVPVELVQAALIVGTARRSFRPPEAPPLGPVRSLAYFLPLIEELSTTPPDPRYLDHLRNRLGLATPTRYPTGTSPS